MESKLWNCVSIPITSRFHLTKHSHVFVSCDIYNVISRELLLSKRAWQMMRKRKVSTAAEKNFQLKTFIWATRGGGGADTGTEGAGEGRAEGAEGAFCGSWREAGVKRSGSVIIPIVFSLLLKHESQRSQYPLYCTTLTSLPFWDKYFELCTALP